MNLQTKDAEYFYRLYSALGTFVNLKFKLFSELKDPSQYLKQDLQQIIKIREKLYENIGVIDEFCKSNPYHFTEVDLTVIRGWKHFVKGPFFVYKQYKNYCIFTQELDNNMIPYGVVGLYDPIENLLSPLPTFIEAVLLPFKDQIIYDGLFTGMAISLGSNMRRNLKERFAESKSKYGIVQQLPFKKPSHQHQLEGELRFYLRNEKNIKFYRPEIEELLSRNPKLQSVYYEEIGKTYAKIYKKRIKELGLKSIWFAVLDDIIVASGKTKSDVERNVANILLENLKRHCILFQVR